ncbi:hypothetical protein LTR67_010263 [Exophiala xenobiotica]
MLAALSFPRPPRSPLRHDALSHLIAPSPRGRTGCSHHGRRLATGVAKADDGRPETPVEPNVDIDSLRNTLRAHRAANRASVIRKVVGEGRTTRLQIGSFLDEPPLRPPKDASKGRKQGARFFLGNINGRTALLSGTQSPPQKGQFGKGHKGSYRDLSGLWRLKENESALPTRVRLPWLAHVPSHGARTGPSALDRLSDEIRAFEVYIAPAQAEKRAAENALSEIVRAIQIADENLDVDIIGSRATGLDDPLSDLDLNVTSTLSPASLNRLRTPVEILDLLEQAFRGRHRSVRLELRPLDVVVNLRHAKVPILVCQHKQSGLPVQIQSTPRTLDNTDYVKAVLQEYPTLRSLYKVLKQTLAMRGLHIGNHGGLTSYPLIIMIVAALKFSEGKFERMDVARQFLYFLDMYAEVDFSTQGISTRPLGYFPKGIKTNEFTQRSLVNDQDSAALYKEELSGQRRMSVQQKGNVQYMTLQDPADPFNELGRNAYQVKDIQETLISLRTQLKEAMAEWDRTVLGRVLSDEHLRSRSLLERCVGGDYRVYESERGELRLVGQRMAKP